MIITKNYRLCEWSGGAIMVEPESYGRCPVCGSTNLKYRDYCRRICREIDDVTKCYIVVRVKCVRCGGLHRILPDFMRPYGQYSEKAVHDIVSGRVHAEEVIEYPCNITMSRWKNKNH